MTGYDVYKKVFALLGYTDDGGERLTENILEIINQISADLKIPQITNLNEKIEASTEKFQALIYGSAMMLAVSRSDSGHAKIFADLYAAKRPIAMSNTEHIKDSLPSPQDGGV